MPLINSGSKKAFKQNIETEMKAHPDERDKNLAIAYNIKRKNKRKKMAEGGMAYKNDSAKTESRPMPSERDNDSKMVSHNSGNKAAHNDSWTDRSTVEQAQRPSKTPLSRPALRGSDAFSVRYRDEIDEDLKRMSSMPPESDKAQPPSRYNEEGPDRQGPSTPSLLMKKMAEGGMINDEVSMQDAEDDMEVHPAGLESDNDQMRPAEDEYMANHFAEGGMAEAIRMRRKYANGGEVDLAMNAEEGPADLEDLNADAAMKENYSESEGLSQLDQPEDSNEHGHELDSDDHDMTATIRRQMNKRRTFGK